MNRFKKIGVAGYGKMGKDIFELLHSRMPDTEFTVYVRHDAERYASSVEKLLSKSLRRGKISEEMFEKLSGNYKFTDDMNDLSDCSLIIESITENIDVKKDFFRELEGIVSNDCVFATNTSSLKISDIFSECSPSRDTMGLHFFYPVKLSSFIEINDSTNSFVGDEIARYADKRTVTFRNKYSFYLNQFIVFCISHAFILADKYNIGVSQCMDILSEIFPVHSLFGMADSIGLGLLTSGNTEDNVERIKPVIDYGKNKMIGYLNSGCSGLTGMFCSFISEVEKDREYTETDKEKFIFDMVSAMLNEAVCAAADNDEALIDALYETIGISEEFQVFYSKYGYEKISENLLELNKYTGIDTYISAEKDRFDKFLIERV